MLIAAIISAVPPAGAQPPGGKDYIANVLRITGAGSAEELDSEVLEHFEHLKNHPLRINNASVRTLEKSQLLSGYQIFTLREYIRTSGAVTSVSELSLIDGFGGGYAQAISPFVSMDAGKVYADSAGIRAEASVKLTSSRSTSDHGVRAFVTARRTEITVSERSGAACAGIAMYSKSGRTCYYAGNFNVRTGQGLAMWSNFSLSGFSGASSFCRRAQGITLSRGFSGTRLRGLAAETDRGRVSFLSFISPGFSGEDAVGGAEVSYYGDNYKAGISSVASGAMLKTSADARVCIKGTDLFGEFCRDWRSGSVAVVCGSSLEFLSGTLSILGRAYGKTFPADYTGAVRSRSKASDELAVTTGYEGRSSCIVVDISKKQSSGQSRAKLLYDRTILFTQSASLLVRCTVTEPFRGSTDTGREEMRADFSLGKGLFSTVFRLQGVHGQGFAGLMYAEGVMRQEKWGASARMVRFDARAWSDRIYMYERDAPGNFSVSTCYGNGYSVSSFVWASLRIKKNNLKAYLKAFYMAYPFDPPGQRKDTEPKGGVRLQLTWKGF